MPAAPALKAELVLAAQAQLAEGPVWDAGAGVLRWTDIPAGQLHRFDPATGTDTVDNVGVQVGAVALRASGGLLLAVQGGFAAYSDSESDGLAMLAPVEADRPDLRFNDGKCDAAGRMYASTMSLNGAAGAGALWRLDTDLSVHRLANGLTIGNGLAWSADGRTMFFTDSATHRIDAFAFDLARGNLSEGYVVAEIAERDGLPDGMCIDDEGCLWVALFGGGAVRRYSPSGKVLAIVDVPAANVTSVAFGGAGLDELFITTGSVSRDETTRAAQPYAGGIFRVRPGVGGPPPEAFAG